MARNHDPRFAGYREHSLPRLDGSCYRADAAVLWTFGIFDRRVGWLTNGVHSVFRELLLHCAFRERLLFPAYVVMPDHFHFACLGTHPKSDQRKAVAFMRTYLARAIAPFRLQPQAHDHVLTAEERQRNGFAGICNYVFSNPVRAGLVKTPAEYSYSGAVVLGYPALNPKEDSFWSFFWKHFEKVRDPECSSHTAVRRLYRSRDRKDGPGECEDGGEEGCEGLS